MVCKDFGLHVLIYRSSGLDFLLLFEVCDTREDMQLQGLIESGPNDGFTHFKGLAAAVRAGGFAPFTVTMAAVARHQLSLLIFGHEVVLVEVRTVCTPPGIVFLRLFELHNCIYSVRFTTNSVVFLFHIIPYNLT